MPVAFLSQFVYTAEAPAYLLDAFEDLVEGPETQGSLADVSSPPPAAAAAAAAASATAMLVPLLLLSRPVGCSRNQYQLHWSLLWRHETTP